MNSADAIWRRLPSTSRLKSAGVRSETGRPSLSTTMTSTATRSTPDRKTACGFCGGGAACSAARRIAPKKSIRGPGSILVPRLEGGLLPPLLRVRAPHELGWDVLRAEQTGQSRDAAPRMGPGGSQIKPANRGTVIAHAKHRPRDQHLIERMLAVMNVTSVHSVLYFQILGRDDLGMHDDALNAGRHAIKHVHDV